MNEVNIHVLVVHRDQGIYQTISKHLKRDGYEFVYANNGQEGLLSYLESKNIDLVFIDIHADKIDGPDFVSRLRAVRDPTPVVFLGGPENLKDSEILAFNSGAIQYLKMPLDLNVLDSVVDNTLNYIIKIEEEMSNKKMVLLTERSDIRQKIHEYFNLYKVKVFDENTDEGVQKLSQYYDAIDGIIIDHKYLENRSDAKERLSKLSMFLKAPNIPLFLLVEKGLKLPRALRHSFFSATLEMDMGAKKFVRLIVDYYRFNKNRSDFKSNLLLEPLQQSLARFLMNYGIPGVRLEEVVRLDKDTSKKITLGKSSSIAVEGELGIRYYFSSGDEMLHYLVEKAFGEDIEDDSDLDVLYEMANQVIGVFKGKVGYNCELSLPEVEEEQIISLDSSFEYRKANFVSDIGSIDIYYGVERKTIINQYLLVDDEPSYLFLVESLIKEIDQQAEVYTASNGAEAIEKYKDRFFHMAFLDLEMPLKNGLETIREMRKFGRCSKFYLVTANMSQEIVHEAMELKIEAVINKRLASEDFERLIQSTLPCFKVI